MGQLDIYGGEHEPVSPAQVPDPALQRRLARRDLNRSLKSESELGHTRAGLVRGTPNEPFAKERIMQATKDFGVPSAQHARSDLSPFANAAWSRLGHYEEIPNTDFVSAQGSVDRRRVQELAADPSLGTNVRLPHEKPYVLRAPAIVQGKSLHTARKIPEANVIINGNHRIMAGIARNEMFSPAQVVQRTPENEDAAYAIQEAKGGLHESALASSVLRHIPGSDRGVAGERTKAFVEEKRRNYWDAGSS